MMRGGRVLLVVLATITVVVGSLDAIARWRWAAAVRIASINPQGGAELLADDPVLALPEAVQRSRRPQAGGLVGASGATLIRALERMSGRQKAWLRTHPVGFSNAARAALLSNDLDAAIGEVELGLVRDPTSPVLHRFAAIVMRASGRYEDFLDHLAEAYAIDPTVEGAGLEVTEDDREWVRIEALERRLERYPRRRVSNVIELAREFKRRGLIEDGRARLAELEPQPEIEIEIARWEVEAGDFGAAAGRLERVTQRLALPASMRVRAWSLLAEARDVNGDSDGALQAARQAIRLDPHSTAPYLALATLAEHRGDDEEALQHLRRAWGIAPADVGLLLRVASAAERAGQPADARLALERAVEVNPDSPDLAARLVDFHLRHGQYMDAALRLSRSMDRFPTDERLLRLADRLRREVGRTVE
jgi:tetratricopeptide (TPR) repeat protein